MTLILTALCKDGISICADKRSKRQYDNGKVEIKDDLNKIYKLGNSGVVICNHGVNEFQGRAWNEYCSDYEMTNQWKGKTEQQILEEFKSSIENTITQQLEDNFRHNRIGSTATGFLICGKSDFDSKFKINELFWSFDSMGVHFESKRHYGLVRTGLGGRYLEKYINNNPTINTVDYWKRINTSQAEKELEKLFIIAVEEKENFNEEEISDGYHLVSVTE